MIFEKIIVIAFIVAAIMLGFSIFMMCRTEEQSWVIIARVCLIALTGLFSCVVFGALFNLVI